MKNRMLKYILTLVLSFFSIAVFSQSYTSNPVTGDWNSSSSWTSGNIPPTNTPTNTAVNIDIASGSYITLNGDLAVNAKGSTLTITGTLIITGSLTFGNDAQLDGGIFIEPGGVLIVMGDFNGPNKIVISASTSPGDGYFYVGGTTTFSGTDSQKSISGGSNIYYETPPSSGSYPTTGYNDCYNSGACSLPAPIQEAIGTNCINVSPTTVDGCISSDQTSFTFALPDATNGCTGQLYYRVIRNYNTSSETITLDYTQYTANQNITISENPTGYSYSVVFYRGNSTTDLLPGIKEVPLNLSNPPTTGTITK